MKYAPIIGLLILIHGFGCPGLVQAHDSRPLYLEITESQENTYSLTLKTPPSLPVSNTPTVTLPEHCEKTSSQPEWGRSESTGPLHYYCRQGLTGQTITLDYPAFKPSIASLIRFAARSGETYTSILAPQQTSWRVPETENWMSVARDYAWLGIYHIWAGVDHLLFLICLLWIARSFRRILITITGFTLAHSMTLALSALKVVLVPVPPVEAAIALSVVFVAAEIARNRRDSLTWRYPIAVSSSFGLLHGLGFAAVLNEIGLPQTQLVTGLLFFNAGVEIGQTLFAVGVILLAAGATKVCNGRMMLKNNLTADFRLVTSYIIGGLSSYWVVERCASFVV